jgi:hypothetical protein
MFEFSFSPEKVVRFLMSDFDGSPGEKKSPSPRLNSLA